MAAAHLSTSRLRTITPLPRYYPAAPNRGNPGHVSPWNQQTWHFPNIPRRFFVEFTARDVYPARAMESEPAISRNDIYGMDLLTIW